VFVVGDEDQGFEQGSTMNGYARDVFVSKHSSDGTLLWRTVIVDRAVDARAPGVDIDADGNLVVVTERGGSFEHPDEYWSLMRMGTDGVRTSEQYLGPQSTPINPRALVIAPTGGVYVAGSVDTSDWQGFLAFVP
jgi:hypothetical protein